MLTRSRLHNHIGSGWLTSFELYAPIETCHRLCIDRKFPSSTRRENMTANNVHVVLKEKRNSAKIS